MQRNIDTVLAYQGADLILLNGAGYARWLKQVSLPRSRLVDTSKTFADRFIPVDAGPLHRHGPEGEHSHQDIATHTWLDFKQAGLQATAVADALVKARPEHEDVFKESLSALLRDLDALDGIVTEPSVRHSPDGTFELTVSGLKKRIAEALRTICGSSFDIDAITVDGDTVWARITLKGATLATMAPLSVTWMAQYRLEGDRIAEMWALHESGLDWND